MHGGPVDTGRLAVLAELPSDGRSLSVVAGDVCGDTHTLDDDTRLSTVVLKALAALCEGMLAAFVVMPVTTGQAAGPA